MAQIVDEPSVSVVIPCYNYAAFLREAVCSVIAQTYTNWELVIVNDGSVDDSAQVARDLTAEFGYLRQRLTVLSIPNSGVSAARNAGIAASRGSYLLPLDADDVIAPTMLEKTAALLDNNPAVAIAYTDIYVFGETVAGSGAEFPEYDFDLLCRQMNYFYCALTRRVAWEAAGGYDPGLPALEDWEFAINCGKRGFAARRIPEQLFGVRHKPTGLHTTVITDNLRLRAQIAVKHAELFNPVTIGWAEAILSGGENGAAPDEILAGVSRPNNIGQAYLDLHKTVYERAQEAMRLRQELDRCAHEHHVGPVPARSWPEPGSALTRWVLSMLMGNRRQSGRPHVTIPGQVRGEATGVEAMRSDSSPR